MYPGTCLYVIINKKNTPTWINYQRIITLKDVLTFEFSLNDFRWIQWIHWKSKNGMVSNLPGIVPNWQHVHYQVALIKITFPYLALVIAIHQSQ